MSALSSVTSTRGLTPWSAVCPGYGEPASCRPNEPEASATAGPNEPEASATAGSSLTLPARFAHGPSLTLPRFAHEPASCRPNEPEASVTAGPNEPEASVTAGPNEPEASATAGPSLTLPAR